MSEHSPYHQWLSGVTDGIPQDQIERAIAAINFCEHLSTELLESLIKEGVGAATFIQWVRRNPAFKEDMGGCASTAAEWRNVCVQCSHIVDTGSRHDEDCLLDKALKIVGDEV